MSGKFEKCDYEIFYEFMSNLYNKIDIIDTSNLLVVTWIPI